jgi:hypothetical protein
MRTIDGGGRPMPMWMMPVAATSLFAFASALGVLRWPRDFVFGLLCLQALVYLYVAPAMVTSQLTAPFVGHYLYFMGWGIPLFLGVFLLAYRGILGELFRGRPSREFQLRPGRSALFACGCCLLTAGYLWVAASRGLFYRRIGWLGLAEAQLELTLPEFAFYRTFIELGPFLAVFLLVALRLDSRAGSRRRWICWAALIVLGGAYLVHVVLNSRLYGVLFLAALAGATALTPGRRGRSTVGWAVSGTLLVLTSLYALRVTENVRTRIGEGRPAFEAGAFLPSGGAGDLEEGYAWRLNGLDLMALIADRIAVEGPAWGHAWEAPFVLAFDPLIRTDRTEQLKREAQTTAKSYLLLNYAGIDLPDYYSCILSDAFGYLGLLGFPVVALTIGGLCAFSTAGITRSPSPSVVVVSCFMLSRVLPFEQEFSTLMFGWFKLLPLLLAMLWLNPLAKGLPPATKAREGPTESWAHLTPTATDADTRAPQRSSPPP